MAETVSGSIHVPKVGDWPGAFDAYKLVKPYIKPRIWDILAAAGLGILAAIVVDVVLGSIFKHSFVDVVLTELAGLAAGAFIQAAIITIYFASLKGDQLTFNGAVNYGFNRLLPLLGLLIVVDVILIVSFVLLIVPFFLILPRIYIAPFFLIYNDCTISEALAASWHLTRGHSGEVYGIIGINLLLGLLCLTIIGIPFAIYWGVINYGSFALLVMSLSETKHAKTKRVKAS